MSGKAKPRQSGRASIPTPPVKFADSNKKEDLGQLSRSSASGKRYSAARSKKQGGFINWLVSFGSRVAIFYVLYAAVWACPSRPFAFDYSPKDARSICRNVALAHDQLVPVIKPYVHLAHQKIEPYTKPVVDAVAPFANRAYKVSRPIIREANKRGRLIWKKRIDPARRRALKSARKQADPYVRKASAYYAHNVQPHVDTIHRTVKPYHDIYQRDVSPYVDQAYQYSLQSSSFTYAFYMDKVHPHIVRTVKQVYSFLVNHVDPAVRRTYSLYVRPQLDRLLAKIYERKAHYLGSDAIKTAQKEMKQAASEADKNAKQTIKKAAQDAIKAQTDPSIVDHIKNVKDAVVNGYREETDPVKVAQLDAELDAEEEKVKEQLEVWEDGMSDLIEKEYNLAVNRLAELRNRKLTDLPDRFGLLNEAFVEDQVALVLSRIERGLRKLSAGANDQNRATRAAAGQKLVDQQLSKLDEAIATTDAQISEFHNELIQQERQTVETSSLEIRRYALAAKDAYDQIMKDAKFAATMDEWEGWDNGVKKRASMFFEELSAVQQGKRAVRVSEGLPDLKTEAPNLDREIALLQKSADSLHKSARREVEQFGKSALGQLASGKGVLEQVADITDRISEQASSISTEAVSGMVAAVSAARAKLGLGDVANDSYFARAKAYAADAAAAAASAVPSSGSSSESGPESVVDAASRNAGAAASSAKSYVDSVTEGVGAAAASVVSSASSAASQASRSVASAVGASIEPEAPSEHVASVSDQVRSAAGAATAGGVASSASSLANEASKSAGSAAAGMTDAASGVAGKLGELAESATSAAGSLAEAVSSSASSAGSMASSAASSAGSKAASVVLEANPYDEIVESAKSLTSSGVIYASSASSAVSSGASSASSAVKTAVENASALTTSVSDFVTIETDAVTDKQEDAEEPIPVDPPAPEPAQPDYVVDPQGSAAPAQTASPPPPPPVPAQPIHAEL
ncbi:hypothetical protein BCV70DRAFT_194336 [Testicularia cyperi]|uniref:Uncharacterized protein n=1 Tax=Testicularia cyperi TaxID=1882483 RepID=A0A317XIL0_9BASI|nr:hypothetical protein BCV70DRAFT_194336 [Testicularia cyperi]